MSKRGEKNAAQIGILLKERELFPQILLSSTALRATQTVDIVAKIIGFTGEVCLDKSLYMAEAEDILKLLRTLPDEIERVMVIGHNPGLVSAHCVGHAMKRFVEIVMSDTCAKGTFRQ